MGPVWLHVICGKNVCWRCAHRQWASCREHKLYHTLWPCPAGINPSMCPRAVFAPSHCLLFSFIPSNWNKLKQYLGVLGSCLLLVLASVLHLVSEAFTIFGGGLCQRVTCSAGLLLNPSRYPVPFCHLWMPLTSPRIRQHILEHSQRFSPGQTSCWAVARGPGIFLAGLVDKNLHSVLCQSGSRPFSEVLGSPTDVFGIDLKGFWKSK